MIVTVRCWWRNCLDGRVPTVSIAGSGGPYRPWRGALVPKPPQRVHVHVHPNEPTEAAVAAVLDAVTRRPVF